MLAHRLLDAIVSATDRFDDEAPFLMLLLNVRLVNVGMSRVDIEVRKSPQAFYSLLELGCSGHLMQCCMEPSRIRTIRERQRALDRHGSDLPFRRLKQGNIVERPALDREPCDQAFGNCEQLEEIPDLPVAWGHDVAADLRANGHEAFCCQERNRGHDGLAADAELTRDRRSRKLLPEAVFSFANPSQQGLVDAIRL